MSELVDRILALGVERTIARARLHPHRGHAPGDKVRVLIIGYSGKRNAGAEVRAAEIIRQLRATPLDGGMEFTVLTLDPDASRGFYPDDVALQRMSSVFFRDLLTACSSHHVGILAEGSCVTNVTSNVAALFFIAAAGILAAQDKPCIGFGVEAGPLNPWLERMVRRHCRRVLYAARTEESLRRFEALGCRSFLGTDAAWTAIPAEPAWAAAELHQRFGVAPGTPLVGLGAMNPFIRPIRASVARYLRVKLTGDRTDQYEKLYFYTNSPERRQLYAAYLDAFAAAARAVVAESGAMPALVLMEPMDGPTAGELEARLGVPTITLSARDYNAAQISALLGQLAMLITSRYHAHVLAMPAAVPCVAVSKDHRLTSLFAEHRLSELCVSTHAADLGTALPAAAVDCWRRRDAIAQRLAAVRPDYVARQHRMTARLLEHLRCELAASAAPAAKVA